MQRELHIQTIDEGTYLFNLLNSFLMFGKAFIFALILFLKFICCNIAVSQLEENLEEFDTPGVFAALFVPDLANKGA